MSPPLCVAGSILHRDIKLQNIFVSKNKTLKLGDFGISRHVPPMLQWNRMQSVQVAAIGWLRSCARNEQLDGRLRGLAQPGCHGSSESSRVAKSTPSAASDSKVHCSHGTVGRSPTLRRTESLTACGHGAHCCLTYSTSFECLQPLCRQTANGRATFPPKESFALRLGWRNTADLPCRPLCIAALYAVRCSLYVACSALRTSH